MLEELRITGLGVIEDTTLPLTHGMNVLTGETGAGKSLLIDSLELLRGARSSTEAIRAGAEKMTAEAVFHLPGGAAETIEATFREGFGGRPCVTVR